MNPLILLRGNFELLHTARIRCLTRFLSLYEIRSSRLRIVSGRDLQKKLESLESASYGAYKQLLDAEYDFSHFLLRFLHVQGDSYAPPSGILIQVPAHVAKFPAHFLSNSVRYVSSVFQLLVFCKLIYLALPEDDSPSLIF
jgi:tRNA splicing endonuclease